MNMMIKELLSKKNALTILESFINASLERAEELIPQMGDLNATIYKGKSSILLLFIEEHHSINYVEKIKLLAKHGADLAGNIHGFPIFFAILMYNDDIHLSDLIPLLEDERVTQSLKNCIKDSMWQSFLGKITKKVDLLIKGANLEKEAKLILESAHSLDTLNHNDKFTLLAHYVFVGNIDNVEELFKLEEFATNRDIHGLSLMELSYLIGNREISSLLLANRLETNNNDILYYAKHLIKLKDYKAITELLESNNIIDQIDESFVSIADLILMNAGAEYDEAINLVAKYSNDPIHAPVIIKIKGGNLAKEFEENSHDRVKIIAPSYDHTWSAEHISMARKMKETFNNIDFYVIKFDQISENNLKNIDGIFLPGGGDNFPSDVEFNLNDLQKSGYGATETYYQYLLDIAEKYHIPTIGICAGNQQIALKNGATLTQVDNYNHGFGHKAYMLEGTLPHFISLNEKQQTLAFKQGIFEQIFYNIITAHNYAVVDNGSANVEIGAFSEEKVVEAISVNTNFIGFQFHPEGFYVTVPGQINVNSNIINNFAFLSEQHFKYKNFAKTHGYSYKQAIEARDEANSIILNVLEQNAKNGQCLIYAQESALSPFYIEPTTIYEYISPQQCKLQKEKIDWQSLEEFHWPAPELSQFNSFPGSDICKIDEPFSPYEEFSVLTGVPAIEIPHYPMVWYWDQDY
jgi:gamma-glutamyl-gamma-aminobutyrate hydrolase PuuD